jgi:prevent-host-death family protein
MRVTGLFAAKQNFSALIEAVAAGEEVRITRHGKEVVRMLPIEVAAAPKGGREPPPLERLQALRARVKPGPSWRELRDLGRAR